MVKSSLQERAHLLFLDKNPKTTICLFGGEFLYLLPRLGCPQSFLPPFHRCQKGFKTSVLPLRSQEMPLTSQEAEHSLRGRGDAGPAPHAPLRPSPRPLHRATPPRACHAPARRFVPPSFALPRPLCFAPPRFGVRRRARLGALPCSEFGFRPGPGSSSYLRRPGGGGYREPAGPRCLAQWEAPRSGGSCMSPLPPASIQ